MRFILGSLVLTFVVVGNSAFSPETASSRNRILSDARLSLPLPYQDNQDTREMIPLPSPSPSPSPSLLPPPSSLSTTSRSRFLSLVAATFCLYLPAGSRCLAFEGGVGGLGKTKPETGVQFFSDLSAPLQNSAGIVSAELNVRNQPVLVTFQSPWPLLSSTAGLEARDLQQPESAFVQVVTEDVPKQIPLTKQSMTKILMASVFNSQGKFSAYGQPVDIKVKETEDQNIFAVSFTTFTPGMKESDRLALIKYCSVGNAIVLLVTGTTSVRYKRQGVVIQEVANSFNAVAAPSSRLR